VIPWLAQNYTASPNLTSYNFTLRSGIQFADGEPLNSTAVYFSLNKLLVEDGSAPFGHGVQASWIIQQLLNTSLSTTLCCAQKYTPTYVNQVLGENFVQITGPLTFTINVMEPNSAFQYLMTGSWADIVAPVNVMQNDVALWNQSSSGYTVPFPNPSGNLSQRMTQYFDDEVATCNAGATPKGCGTTYLDGSYQGSVAGTGPYLMKSFSATSNDIVLQANPKYWGSPYQYMGGSKITANIPTIDVNYVPTLSTREIDLKNAAASGQALTADIPATNLYDVASENQWLNNNSLVSIIPSVSLYGPYAGYAVGFYPFATNVSNPQTGQYYSFQPFADLRLRLAFADAVNLSLINTAVNNKLGVVAPNGIPPGLPPAGAYNASNSPIYSFNPDKAAQLLLQAMEQPITHFTFENGTAASSGVFNNTFGCSSLGANGQCSKPVPQNIFITYDTGDSSAQSIMTQIATTINNISSTYNMGLTVSVQPIPGGLLFTEISSAPANLYFCSETFSDDYPWVLDFSISFFAPTSPLTIPEGWNLTSMVQPWKASVNASATGDVQTIIKENNIMNQIANNEVMYLWSFYPANFDAITSNLEGLYFNPSIYDVPLGYYFASLY
jgi:ABC-type transport system substrate-binding protein